MKVDFEQFKSDVLAKCDEMAAAEPGPKKAIDWSKAAAALAKADDVIQRAKPIVESFTPDQYDFVVEAVAAAIHGINSQVNPAS